MDDQIQTMAEAAARHLLLNFQEEHPDWSDDRTPVDELVSWLGLHVETFHPNDYPPGTYGLLEPDEDLIWLCRDLPETLRRFTLAHELAHAVLHRHVNGSHRHYTFSHNLDTSALSQHVPEISPEDPCQRPDVQEEVMGRIDQDQFSEVGQLYNPRSQRELAANIFAAELLMPLDRVRTLYLAQQISPGKLASLFDVSAAAMLNRLVGLLMEPPETSIQHEKEREIRRVTKQYDEFQQMAIEAPTPALIVAGPGSGKTSTLIGRTEYLIHTLGVQPQHILALTFSRKAAQEMRERLQHALNTSHTFPTVSTFHAFCAELLRTHGELLGLREDFTFVDDTEGFFLLRQLARAMPLQHYRNLKSPTYYFPEILKAISRAKDELVTPEQYQYLAQQMLEQAQNDEEVQKAQKALEVAAVYMLYQTSLQQRGDSDFGGLILLAVQLLQQYPEVLREQQQRYQHILVDEFQDMNRASGVLLRLLAGDERCVWVVGDANQAIYGFRGASPANIANFQEDYPGAAVLPLSRNYRSQPDLVSFAESFRCKQLEVGTDPGKNQPTRLTSPDAYVTLAVAVDDASELAGLAADIRHKQAAGYSCQDMVVLCRTRAQARKISHALAQAGLPVIESGSTLEQEHIKNLLSIILLLAEPSGKGILRAARQSEHALTQSDIEALLLAAREQQCTPGLLIARGEAPPHMSGDGRRSLLRLSNILQALQYVPNVWSLLAQYLFIETSLVRDLLSNPESAQAQQILADYTALLQLARRYDQRLQREQEADEHRESASLTIQEQAKGFLDYLSVLLMLRQDGNNRQQSAEGNGEDSSEVIRVMTVHASKGLEFPIVYLPGLVQRRFPLTARSSPVSAPAGMLPPESEGAVAHESGESCLFYVGATRARDHLVLSYSERYGKQKYKTSLYLDALGTGLSGERIRKLRWEGGIQTITPEEATDDLLPSSQPSEDFINAMKSTTLSASAIETYQMCPRRYAYSKIYRFQTEEGAYQLFRQATQKTLEALQKNLLEANGAEGAEENREARLLTEMEARALYTHYWQELGGHTSPFASFYEQHGHEIIESVRSKLAESKAVTWELHPNFVVEVAGKTIHVPVDRVEAAAEAGKPVKFVRTHFGKRKEKPTAEARELLYARAYRQQHPGQNVELHYHNLSTDETLPITLTEKREQSLHDEVEQAILGLERNEYPAKPDPFHCPTCPFFLICPA